MHRIRSTSWRLSAWAATLAGIGLLRAAPAAEPPIAWLTGSPLNTRLAEPADVYWSDTPLRQAVNSLSHAHRVAVLIDRRVDPGQELGLKLSGQPLSEVFQAIAESRGLAVGWVGPVAYVGPPAVTARVRTLAELRREEIRRLPPEAGRKFLLPKRIRWDDFATPRDLLSRLAGENRIEVFGLDQIPHDLWAGADLPPLGLVDRLTLIAGQFDLTFQVAADGTSIALVPVPDDVAIVRTYPGGREPEQLARKWAALVSDSQVKVVGGQIQVRGALDDHDRIAESLRPPPRQDAKSAPKRRGEDTFSGKIAGQLGQLLESLATRFQLELRIDQRALKEAGVSLEQYVSVTVKDATVDELFEAVVSRAGCTCRRRGRVIEVRPGQ